MDLQRIHGCRVATVEVVAVDGAALDEMVTALVPSLSRSLAEQFNVFRVMRHGTHEKQLSNVFAWLLSADGTHGLGDAVQRIFVAQVNRGLPIGAPDSFPTGRLPGCPGGDHRWT